MHFSLEDGMKIVKIRKLIIDELQFFNTVHANVVENLAGCCRFLI